MRDEEAEEYTLWISDRIDTIDELVFHMLQEGVCQDKKEAAIVAEKMNADGYTKLTIYRYSKR